MDALAECTHCRVIMTTWAAPGSPVRYWQCPFCGRTHSSAYGEVFRSGAGARLVPPRPAAGAAAQPAAPRPTGAVGDLALLKARAVRWFERLEAEGRPSPAPARPRYEPAAARARLAGRHR